MGRIVDLDELKTIRREVGHHGLVVVFTNGVFDLLHRGHVEFLAKAKELGDILVVGLNSDASVQKVKGDKQPITPQEDRAYILSHLEPVDYVTIFEEVTPQRIIEELLPDVLVKGGDYQREEIVGCQVVETAGGRVETIPLTPGRSTKSIIESIVRRFGS